MSEGVFLALIGFVGAILGAVLTALLQPVWERLIGTKAVLRVDVVPTALAFPAFLSEAIDAYAYNYKLNIRPTEEMKDRLLALRSRGGLLRLTISNQSSVAIAGIAAHIDESDVLGELSHSDGPVSLVQGRVFEVGTLRPRESAQLALWLRSDPTGRWADINKVIRITANQFDRIRVVVATTGAVRARYLLIDKSWLWKSFIALQVLWWIYLGISLASWLQRGGTSHQPEVSASSSMGQASGADDVQP